MPQTKANLIAWLLLIHCLSGCGDFAIGPGGTDFSAKLVHGYELWQNSGTEVFIRPRETGVPMMVVSLGFDDQFIVAKQQLMDARDLYPLAGQFRYWIIDAPSHQRHGPLTEKEFIAKRKELGVSEEIVLKGKNSYRP